MQRKCSSVGGPERQVVLFDPAAEAPEEDACTAESQALLQDHHPSGAGKIRDAQVGHAAASPYSTGTTHFTYCVLVGVPVLLLSSTKDWLVPIHTDIREHH